jgi:hypothetical protein
MRDHGKPDLDIEIYEQIEIEQTEIQKSYWKQLKPVAVTETQLLLLAAAINATLRHYQTGTKEAR